MHNHPIQHLDTQTAQMQSVGFDLLGSYSHFTEQVFNRDHFLWNSTKIILSSFQGFLAIIAKTSGKQICQGFHPRTANKRALGTPKAALLPNFCREIVNS